ncbi:P-loop containing nucleoside triphosphate hydrolase protein [Trametes sanguinea]|nr:P-loop containing nucleoside triphosphate hydrolase protein [Trametes sanguinea]
MPALDPHRLAKVIPGFAEAEIPYKRLSLDQCNRLGTLLSLGRGTEAQAVGVSLRLSEKGAITSVAFATEALVIQINTEVPKSSSGFARADTFKGIANTLNNSRCLLVGVGMQRIALLLRHQLQADCTAVDLTTLFPDLVERGVPSPGEIAQEVLSSRAQVFKINALWHHETNNDLCIRAWLVACIGCRSLQRLKASAKLRTGHLRAAHIERLAVTAMNIELLEAKKPTRSENEFSKVDVLGSIMILHNARFQNRVRKSRQTIIQINGGAMEARAFEARGRRTELQVVRGRALASVDIVDVRVLGREEATSAELARDEFFSHLLEDSAVLDGSPFNRLLWFPTGKSPKPRRRQATDQQFAALNASQRVVAGAMTDDKEQLVVTHGPPGTGKTTTIAAALEYWQVKKQPVWVIAQSNVGVKNIARSIIKRGIKFKLIVSKEFYFEWHEHLYDGEVKDTLIRSEWFFGADFDPKHAIGDVQVILCTLAMLSNPMLAPVGMFAYRPVERLVVDEASQIDVSEFMHLFDRFDKLRKVCMFGDPKQLPPFGKEHAPKMQTIFDFAHLRKRAYFLDTQYRMPVPLGDFVSKEVYRSQLKSVHNVISRDCVKAIDVRKGVEEGVGTSWKNMEEAHTVVNLVRHYYRKLKFCIITPYDAQRATITSLLKGANLPSDVVYNVDSFQGTQTQTCGLPRALTADTPALGIHQGTKRRTSSCRPCGPRRPASSGSTTA